MALYRCCLRKKAQEPLSLLSLVCHRPDFSVFVPRLDRQKHFAPLRPRRAPVSDNAIIVMGARETRHSSLSPTSAASCCGSRARAVRQEGSQAGATPLPCFHPNCAHTHPDDDDDDDDDDDCAMAQIVTPHVHIPHTHCSYRLCPRELHTLHILHKTLV